MPQVTTEVRKMIAEAQDIIVGVSAPVAVMVCAISEYAARRGNDRSFDYWLEEALIAGCEAKQRSWEYADKARDAREFQQALNTSKIKGLPQTTAEQLTFAELAVKYHQFDMSETDIVELREKLKLENAAKLAAEHEVKAVATKNGH